MRLKVVTTVLAAIAAVGLLALPADAAPKKKRIAYNTRGQTVFISRDENGRTHTRIIIQKRSYLDPGTETSPGERSERNWVSIPGQSAISVLDNTAAGANQSPLPGPYTLPSKNNPWLEF